MSNWSPYNHDTAKCPKCSCWMFLQDDKKTFVCTRCGYTTDIKGNEIKKQEEKTMQEETTKEEFEVKNDSPKTEKKKREKDIWKQHVFIEEHKAEIFEDVDAKVLSPELIVRKWGISRNTLDRLIRKRKNENDPAAKDFSNTVKRVLKKAPPAPLPPVPPPELPLIDPPQTCIKIPNFPEFNPRWRDKVKIAWFEQYTKVLNTLRS